MKTLLIVANVDWFIISHRLGIAIEAKNRGWEVYVAATDTGRRGEIEIHGLKFIDLRFSRSGTAFWKELATLWKFICLYRKLKPDVIHHITLKPVTYGTIAAKMVGIKGVVNAISGLGYSFIGEGKEFTRKSISMLMRYGFKRKNVSIIFQNDEDEGVLRSLGVLSNQNKIIKIKGSGVDLLKFKESPFPSFSLIKILFPSRMLWDKGVKELMEASVILKDKYWNKIQFILAGMADSENKTGVPIKFLEDWADGKYVNWIGYQSSMVSVYMDSHIVVLPSYREGMPKSLIEACAIGRPIVTTDAPGCKDCVDEGVNGYKVPIRNSIMLAAAIEKMILNISIIGTMGHKSRIKAVEEFNVKKVIDKHIDLYEDFI